MGKIKVNVCLGSSCFVDGRKNLGELKRIVFEKYDDKVEVESVPCMQLCSIKMDQEKVPYAKVDDDVIESWTIQKILDKIDEKLSSNKA